MMMQSKTQDNLTLYQKTLISKLLMDQETEQQGQQQSVDTDDIAEQIQLHGAAGMNDAEQQGQQQVLMIKRQNNKDNNKLLMIKRQNNKDNNNLLILMI